MRVAEAVGRTLGRLGADHVFGVVGSGNFHVTNALVAAGARFVAARHEGGAATMADAYARVSGEVGVLTVHQGCGLTNATTGIAEAAKSRTPLLVLAAEVAGAAVRSNFRIDQAGLATAVGAVPERVHSATVRGGRHGAGVPAGGGRAPHRGAQPAAGRAGRGARRRAAGAGRRGAGPAAAIRRRGRGAGGPAGGGPAAGLPRRARRPARPRGRWRRSPTAAARCWPRPRSRTASSAARPGRWASPAASPPRWPPS